MEFFQKLLEFRKKSAIVSRMGRGQDQYSLQKQRQVLTVRTQALKMLNKDTHPPLDTDALLALKALSPEGLAPCLVRRKRDGFSIAAYLIQRIGADNSCRLLVRTDSWRILRAQRGSEVLRIRPEQFAVFDEVVRMQELSAMALLKLVATTRKIRRAS